MSRKPKLMARLDEAAELLLDRYFKSPILDGGSADSGADQIKAFDAVVKYFGPRTKLGGEDDKDDNEFSKLKDRLHGNRKTARGPRGGPSQGGANGGPTAADDPAGNA